MKAVLHTSGAPEWVRALGLETWALAPVVGRPLLEYWLELCDLLRIRDVRLVLGDGAHAVETYAQDGSRWGLKLTYSFLGPGEDPDRFLHRAPELWAEGLFYLGTPLFPRRLGTEPLTHATVTGTYLHMEGSRIGCLASVQPEFLQTFLAGGELALGAQGFGLLGITPDAIANLHDYFELNLRMVRGECARYVSPGYFSKDGAHVGYNVILPPSAHVQSPLVIGNHTRLGALTVIGPDVVLGEHCIVDRQSELTRCVILDGTYIGRNLEICDKIIAGRRLIDPADGTVAGIDDPWLLAKVSSSLRAMDVLRALLGWSLALLLALAQLVPFLLLAGLLKLTGQWRFLQAAFHTARQQKANLLVFPDTSNGQVSWLARLFRALSLDRFPALLQVLAGRLWLCGQEPLATPADDALRYELQDYFPAAFSYATPRTEASDAVIKRVDAYYYAHHRSLAENGRILVRALLGRLAALCAPSAGDAA